MLLTVPLSIIRSFTLYTQQRYVSHRFADSLRAGTGWNSNLTFRWPCIVINSYNKTKLDALISQIYFWNKTLHASDSSSLHHQEFFTVHTAMVNVIQVCWQQLQFRPDPARCQAVSKPVWHIPLLCVQWKTPDGGQTNCLKHVEFYSKNKFEKLVHVVDFIIRIHHDTRSSERQIRIPLWSCCQAVSKPAWHIPLLCVQWKTPDDGQRNCLKHVEFYSKNKFEKLVHLVGFIIRTLIPSR